MENTLPTSTLQNSEYGESIKYDNKINNHINIQSFHTESNQNLSQSQSVTQNHSMQAHLDEEDIPIINLTHEKI